MRFITLGMLFSLVAAQAATVTVNIEKGLQFVPKRVQIQLGDTVEFVNQTSFPHTATADRNLVKKPTSVILPNGAAPFNSGVLGKGARFQHTFTVPGLYQYTCLPHELMGMQGQVQVVGSSFEEQDAADFDSLSFE